MSTVCSIFSQVLKLIPRGDFDAAVRKHQAERNAKGFTSWGQLVAMLFCQLGSVTSLRDITNGLAASEGKLRHLGLPSAPKRSTLAYANSHRPSALFEDLFYGLLETARSQARQAGVRHKFRFRNKLLSIDATTIELCASVFDWAKFRRAKGAVKLHLALDHDGLLPCYGVVTDGKQHEVTVTRQWQFEPGTVLVFDRGYTDYDWFAQLTRQGVFFVTRLKSNADFIVVEDRPLPQRRGIVRDRIVCMTQQAAEGDNPPMMRRVEFYDEKQLRTLVFPTNHLKLAAATVAEVYKNRWQIGVSSQGHINQPVQVRPRPTDSSLVAGEAPWRESKTVKPSDNMLRKEYAQLTRLQCAVNADVASLHDDPEAETVYNARKQQEPVETSPMRRLSPAGYQRRHGGKVNVSTGEALGIRRRNFAEEMTAITLSGKCRHRCQGGGSGRSTGDGRAAKRARREGPGPVSIPRFKVRQGVK